MSIIELTADSFQEAVVQHANLVIDFWAAWCGPCRAFAPTFEAAAERHPDFTFAKVNTETEQTIAAAFNIRSIPTLMVFRDQIIVYAEAGALSGSALDELLEQARALDMDQVRKEISSAM